MNLKRQSLIQGANGFIFTMIVITSLITLQFIWVYSDEFSKKYIDIFTILNFIFFSFVSFMIDILPTGIVVMLGLYYRKHFQSDIKRLKIIHNIFLPIILSIFGFIWISFLLPKVKLHMVSLLYDIQITAPEESLKRTDISFFENLVISKNYFQLSKMIDSLETNDINENEIGSAIFGVSEVREAKITKAKMIIYPFFIFIISNLGIFLGVLNRRNNLFLFLISIYLSFFPLSYYLQNYFENLSTKSNLSPMLGQFYNILVWAILTVIIGIYMKIHLKQKSTSIQNVV